VCVCVGCVSILRRRWTVPFNHSVRIVLNESRELDVLNDFAFLSAAEDEEDDDIPMPDDDNEYSGDPQRKARAGKVSEGVVEMINK